MSTPSYQFHIIYVGANLQFHDTSIYFIFIWFWVGLGWGVGPSGNFH